MLTYVKNVRITKVALSNMIDQGVTEPDQNYKGHVP